MENGAESMVRSKGEVICDNLLRIRYPPKVGAKEHTGLDTLLIK